MSCDHRGVDLAEDGKGGWVVGLREGVGKRVSEALCACAGFTGFAGSGCFSDVLVEILEASV
jgi:hypothetical protein